MNTYKRIVGIAAGGLLIAASLSVSAAQEDNLAGTAPSKAEMEKADPEKFDQQRMARQMEVDHELAEWNAVLAKEADGEAALAKQRIAQKTAGRKRLNAVRAQSKSRAEREDNHDRPDVLRSR